jgi:hypothetical protein
MSTALLVVIIIVAVAVLVVAFLVGQQQRTRRLRDRFGPEYQRTVARTGNRRAGEAQLAEREQRRSRLEIIELEPSVRSRYLEAWRVTQGKFVDDPVAATREADELVSNVMRDRGYPVDDFEQRADDISVDHPQVAENYRAAHAVSLANARGLASTDDLRQAFVLWGAETRIRVVSRRSGPSGDALHALVDRPPADPPAGPPER